MAHDLNRGSFYDKVFMKRFSQEKQARKPKM